MQILSKVSKGGILTGNPIGRSSITESHTCFRHRITVRLIGIVRQASSSTWQVRITKVQKNRENGFPTRRVSRNVPKQFRQKFPERRPNSLPESPEKVPKQFRNKSSKTFRTSSKRAAKCLCLTVCCFKHCLFETSVKIARCIF